MSGLPPTQLPTLGRKWGDGPLIPHVISPNYNGRTVQAMFNVTNLPTSARKAKLECLIENGYGASILEDESSKRKIVILCVTKISSTTNNFDSPSFEKLIGEDLMNLQM